jgi:hypothetical protein
MLKGGGRIEASLPWGGVSPGLYDDNTRLSMGLDRRRNTLRCRHHPEACVVSSCSLGHMHEGLDTWQRLSDATRPSWNLAGAVDEALHFLSAVLHCLVRAPVF